MRAPAHNVPPHHLHKTACRSGVTARPREVSTPLTAARPLRSGARLAPGAFAWWCSAAASCHMVTKFPAFDQAERDERQLAPDAQRGGYRRGAGQHDGDQQCQAKGGWPGLQEAFEPPEPCRVDKLVASASVFTVLRFRFRRRRRRRVRPCFRCRVTCLPARRP